MATVCSGAGCSTDITTQDKEEANAEKRHKPQNIGNFCSCIQVPTEASEKISIEKDQQRILTTSIQANIRIKGSLFGVTTACFLHTGLS